MGNSSKSVKAEKTNPQRVKEKMPSEVTGRNWTLLCIALLFLITVVQFSSFIFSDKMLVASDQLGGLDSKFFLSKSLTHFFQFPNWFSPRLAGMPTVDALFGDALYPPSIALSFVFSAFRVFGFKMILHVFLAGLFFFMLLRRSFGLSRLVAFTGAAFFMLSPQFVSHVYPGHDGKMYVIAWLPFIIWRLRSLMNKPSMRNASLMGLGVGMSILTSHIQMSYFVLWGVFLYWVTAMVLSIKAKETKNLIISKGGYFWVAVLFGLGLSFIQFFPSYMYIRDAFSVRGVDRGFDHATSWSMHWAEFFSLWVHEFGNSLQYYWGKNPFKLNTEYAGMIPVLLSVLAIVSKPKSVWRIFWASVAVLASLYALGANTPFFEIVYHLVPGVKKFRAPSMIMFWFSFSTVMLSVYFLKDLFQDRFKFDDLQKKRWTKGLLIAIGSVTLLAIVFSSKSFVTGFVQSMMGAQNAFRVFEMNFSENFIPSLWLWWLFAVAALSLLAVHVNGKLTKQVFCVALLIMGLVDTLRVNSQFIKVESQWKHFYRNDAVLDELKNKTSKDPFRVFSIPGTFARNQEGVYGLEGVGGFHDNELRWYREFRGDQRDGNYLESMIGYGADGKPYLNMEKIDAGNPFLDLADVRYILFRHPSGGIKKVRNKGALGRLSYASDYVVMQEERITSALRNDEYDYRSTVALTETPQLPFERKGKGDASFSDKLKIEWKKYSPNRRVAQVTMPSDGFLRISEVYYPAWRIKVNGSEKKYYRSDVAWMAVPLKAGEYLVEMEPRSLYMDKAALVSLFFLLFGAFVWVYAPVKRFWAEKVKG